ncbi:MAG: glycosyltransferase [Anaerolineaceae bacterium]|nr:glycosyltransferase [Anaerolineaceae bacterium]
MGADWRVNARIFPVRILYFTRDYTPHDYRFLTALAGQGLDVFFLRLERGGRQLEDRSLPPTVNQIVWRGGQAPFRWRDIPALLLELRSILRRVQPDIVHAGPIQTAAFLSALSGFRPLVSMSWGSDLLRDAKKNRWYRWITRFTLLSSTVLVGDCQAVRDCAISFGLPAEKVFTFPWGIDLDRFAPETRDAAGEVLRSSLPPPEKQSLRSRLGWQDNFVVLSLRSWEPVYGIDVLLRGFARAAQESPHLRLLLMGGGSLAPMVHHLIQQYNLADRVYLGGQVSQNDLPQFYHSADLYVSASRSDGSSVSLMEALGCGLPVLISDIPANREWVTDGEQGWLFADGDPVSLSTRLLLALNQSETMQSMRQAARLQALKRANWQENFKTLLKAYDCAIRIRQ